MSDARPPSSDLRLLAVLAHPDDETLGLGGLLARCAVEGVATYLVTATHGQSGRYHDARPGEPGHPGLEGLAQIREAELRAATAVLGVRELHLLGYVDGRLDQVDPVEIVDRIAAHVRRIRPHVIITFAQDGGYGHPDHIAICQFATAAAVRAADPTHAPTGIGSVGPGPHAASKLYYMAWGEGHMAAYQEAFKTLTSKVDGVERSAHPWPEWMLTTVVDTRALWPTVWKAVQCHESQIGNFAKLKDLSPENHEAIWGRATFYRAFSTVNGGRTRETDVFEGLRPRGA